MVGNPTFDTPPTYTDQPAPADQANSIAPNDPKDDESKQTDPAVESFVVAWLDKIQDSKEHWDKEDFQRMREDMMFAAGVQWQNQADAKDDRYVANIVSQIIRQRVAALYAKNPTFVAKRHERMDFAMWDEDYASLRAAMQNPADPLNMQLINDIMQGYRQRKMLDKLCDTLEIVFKNQIMEQSPVFKRQMKQLVRRVETCGAGWVKLDYHRAMEVDPEINAQINDMATRLSGLQAMMEEADENDYGEKDKEMEELRIAMETLQATPFTTVREGLVFSFPRATSIIVDKNCYQLDGLLGARFVAEEMFLPCDDIYRIYEKEVEGDATTYTPQESNTYSTEYGKMIQKTEGKNRGYYCVYIVYDLDTFSTFVLCKGFKDYLKEPEAPKLQLQRFFPYYPLTFNDIESEDSIYPPSTVRLLKHQQREYNRAKEALRQHRIASKPLYASATGALEEEDKVNISQHEAHDCIEIQGMTEGQKVDDKFQMVKKHPIDPNVYDTNSTFQDISKIIGWQSADIGAISGATATETSVAEDSRVSAVSSNADDLDDFMSAFVRDAGHTLLLNFSADKVREIAGPGAVWPQFAPQDIVNDIYLDIEAGSSGRPNKAAESAAVQKLYPLLVQLPGVNPEPLTKLIVKLLDENIDVADYYIEGLPSIMAMNAQAGAGPQPPTGNPATNPADQGPQGANNQPTAPGPQGNPGGVMPTHASSAPQRAGGMIRQLPSPPGG